jgi:hypothetical protein
MSVQWACLKRTHPVTTWPTTAAGNSALATADIKEWTPLYKISGGKSRNPLTAALKAGAALHVPEWYRLNTIVTFVITITLCPFSTLQLAGARSCYISLQPSAGTETRILRPFWISSTIFQFFKHKKTTKLRGFSPQANYTDRATVACRRS